MKDVIVIGGGASGILFSIALKERLKDKVNVTILEKEDRIGKKILKTGNGKCNVTNINLNPSFYNDADFVTPVLTKYDYKYINEYLSSLGILMKNDEEGRVYPYSESAAAFLDVLKNKLELNNVDVHVNEEVKKVISKGNKYLVKSNDNEYICDYVILAMGSKAQTKNYSYNIIDSLMLDRVEDKPGLVSIKVKEKIVSLSGLRMKCNVKLMDGKKNIFSSYGEVLFKDDYLSGIVIMSSSRYIKEKNKYKIFMDLLPKYNESDLIKYFDSLDDNLSGEHILMGILPKMLSIYVLKCSGINLLSKVKDLSNLDKKNIVNILKNMEFNVVGVNDYDKAQINMGGISLNEINKETLELNKRKKIYVLGEVMDVDGECGGFNLSWAWASALCVANIII